MTFFLEFIEINYINLRSKVALYLTHMYIQHPFIALLQCINVPSRQFLWNWIQPSHQNRCVNWIPPIYIVYSPCLNKPSSVSFWYKQNIHCGTEVLYAELKLISIMYNLSRGSTVRLNGVQNSSNTKWFLVCSMANLKMINSINDRGALASVASNWLNNGSIF